VAKRVLLPAERVLLPPEFILLAAEGPLLTAKFDGAVRRDGRLPRAEPRLMLDFIAAPENLPFAVALLSC
jgi:hypothetical protein